MRLARILAAFVLLGPIASAQTSSNAPAEVTGVNVSQQSETEVSVELATSALVLDAKVIATYPDLLILDLPGAVYRALPRRIAVSQAGVRAIRVWMQSEEPALTRVAIEIDRTEQYLVSVEGGAVVLRVGPQLEGAPAATPNTAEVTGRRSATPAARGSASANAASAIAGIFRRGPGKPTTYGNSKIRDGEPVRPDFGDGETSSAQSASKSTPSQGTPAPTDTQAAAASPADGLSEPRKDSTAVEPTPVAPGAVVPVTIGAAAVALTNLEKSASSSEPRSDQPPTAAEIATTSGGGEARNSSGPPPPAPTETPAIVAPTSQAAANPAVTSNPVEVTKSASASSAEALPKTNEPPTVAPTSSPAEEAVLSEPTSKPSVTVEATSTGVASEVPSGDMSATTAAANPGMRMEFHVKHVAQDSAYIDGGRSAGLSEGMKMVIRKPKSDANEVATNSNDSNDQVVAELVVVGVAETSAVTEIHTPKRTVIPGDVAYLSAADVEAMVQEHTLGATRKYPVVIAFSGDGEALDEEARAYVPKEPLPSVNRASARIGLDYTGTKMTDSSQTSFSGYGAVLRADFTRIGGTYWNLSGYWRGRLSSTSGTAQPTLQDLLNRTYHLGLTYENPNSRWVVGAGRLFLPWATSLDTLDGGYFGARLGHGLTVGGFGGSTPDPTSWDYSPNRHIAGGFLNEDRGSYDGVHYSVTAGGGKSFEMAQYSTPSATGTTGTTTSTTTSTYPDNRPFAFLENSLTYKRVFTVFDALQADKPSGNPAVASPGLGLSRNFLTVRYQPVSRLELEANETYFRDIPTFDPQLIGTGLLDKYLFQGFSGGVRVEVIKNITVYTDLGRSSRTGDASTSLNQMYGVTFLKIPKLDLRADAHYSRFNSSFGSGTYRAFSLSRSVREEFHFEVLAGDQVFTSSLAGNQNAKFLTLNSDSALGAMFFLQGGFTIYRGQLQNYNQWDVTLGYRFDNKWKH